MIAYQQKKISHAINFFASEHYEKTRQHPTQTMLYKYLAFLDFYSLRRHGFPALGLKYRAMEHGPVPVEIYDNRDSLPNFRKNADGSISVHPQERPDLDYFSKQEFKIMGELIEIFAIPETRASHMSDSSHEQIAAWRKTWQNNPNGIIDYSSEFDDIDNKKEKDLSFAEEVFLMYRATEV